MAVDIVSGGPMSCHCLLGEAVALPAALKVVEDFELKFVHGVVVLCSNAIPNHRISLVEYSSFLGRKGLEILRSRNGLGYTVWNIRHGVEEVRVRDKVGEFAQLQKRQRRSFTQSGRGKQ
jgi:hypothetical protein